MPIGSFLVDLLSKLLEFRSELNKVGSQQGNIIPIQTIDFGMQAQHRCVHLKKICAYLCQHIHECAGSVA
jgi:hypothetical protein